MLRRGIILALLLLAVSARGEDDLTVGGGRIRVTIDDRVAQDHATVLRWVNRAAEAVTHYYGRFPVKALDLSISRRRGDAVNSGTTYDGRRIVIHLDPRATRADLDADWMLTHEMFHLGFPSLDERYHYLEEGLSDYLEPLARARVGQLSDADVWRGFVEGMPQGLPRRGQGGLDGTRDWGRTYWGGCIFWLLVDLDIRRRSNGDKSLDDAIRAIVDAGGTGDADWPLERVLATGDAATGTGSLRRIHDFMGPHPYDPDLPSLWRSLGVQVDHGAVTVNDHAPEATIRKAMTAPTREAK